MCHMQLTIKVSLIDQIDKDVKLTKKVTIKLFDTGKTMGISKVPNHEYHDQTFTC